MSAVESPVGVGDSVRGELLLEVEDMRVTYGNVVAVDDFSFGVRSGSVTGLIGPNGAGKTTVIDALTGYVKPTGGRVRLAGRDITGMRPHALARNGLIRTFQSVELFDDLTVEENLQVASSSPGVLGTLAQLLTPTRSGPDDRVQWAMSVTDLAPVAGRYPRELSHGQRKLVGVARALAAQPEDAAARRAGRRTRLCGDPVSSGIAPRDARARGRRAADRPRHGAGADDLRRHLGAGLRAKIAEGRRRRSGAIRPSSTRILGTSAEEGMTGVGRRSCSKSSICTPAISAMPAVRRTSR